MFGAPTWFGIDVIRYSDALLVKDIANGDRVGIAASIAGFVPGGDIAKTARGLRVSERSADALRRELREAFLAVHGAKEGHQVHHVLPFALRDRFAGLGIDANDAAKWGAYWPKDSHQKLWYEYQQRWIEWLDAHPNASEDEVAQFVLKLGVDYPFIRP